jgi:hypothetical protein
MPDARIAQFRIGIAETNPKKSWLGSWHESGAISPAQNVLDETPVAASIIDLMTRSDIFSESTVAKNSSQQLSID